MQKALGCPLWKVFHRGQALVLWNELFYFIETCSLTNYADDNTLDMISTTIETVLSFLRADTEHGL